MRTSYFVLVLLTAATIARADSEPRLANFSEFGLLANVTKGAPAAGIAADSSTGITFGLHVSLCACSMYKKDFPVSAGLRLAVDAAGGYTVYVHAEWLGLQTYYRVSQDVEVGIRYFGQPVYDSGRDVGSADDVWVARFAARYKRLGAEVGFKAPPLPVIKKAYDTTKAQDAASYVGVSLRYLKSGEVVAKANGGYFQLDFDHFGTSQKTSNTVRTSFGFYF